MARATEAAGIVAAMLAKTVAAATTAAEKMGEIHLGHEVWAGGFGAPSAGAAALWRQGATATTKTTSGC